MSHGDWRFDVPTVSNKKKADSGESAFDELLNAY